jgi:hypothetical protein
MRPLTKPTQKEISMRYLRFILTPAVMSLVFAYFMPLCGVTLPAGAVGALTAVGLGVAYTLVFAGFRYLEHWLVKKFAKTRCRLTTSAS